MAETPPEQPTAQVIAVQEDIVRIALLADDEQPLMKNEVVYIVPTRVQSQEDQGLGNSERLKAEVLRIDGRCADVQVYESTLGVGLGDPVYQSGELLSVDLGPGLLGQVYDGLQNPLEGLAVRHGLFLPRGVALPGLDQGAKWSFTPTAREGTTLRSGDVVGTVPEGHIRHKIMVPFGLSEAQTVVWIQAGSFTVQEPVARLVDRHGRTTTLTLSQSWPVRNALAQPLLRRRYSQRLHPDTPLITTQRLIDTFFPIAQGGTACIPGPFGAGKTVLQNLISRYADVDIVIIVACGERAGEVVETITEFPRLNDPKTGGSLMDRTVIICNTSSMPVAAREASIYTGLTIGEYYRQMGLKALLIADSTSRWAQAMRETSGRLEEIPGEEAFPAYLDSAIKGVYERAGVIGTNDGSVGSLTMIGTVSPAGGNFEEPVTQSTLATVKCFLGLSADRAYKRFYPAIDPLLSWSRYLAQLAPWYRHHLHPHWTDQVEEMVALLRRGDGVLQMMQVTGEEGVTLADFIAYHKALLVDMVYLQQDAFDDVDCSVSLARQRESFARLHRLVSRAYGLPDKAAVATHFTKLTGLLKNLNYAAFGSDEYRRLSAQIEALDSAAALAPTAAEQSG